MSDPFSVRIEGLQKTFGDRTVLDVDQLEFESGSSVALVGPNGCGKSTLLRVLSGVMMADAGSIQVDGVAHEDVRVGYMPQKSYAFGFSVLRNVELALKSRHVPKEEARRRAEAALEEVGMADLASERGSGLSGGEAQRVALARMLVQDLDVLLLDEPTASMDIAGTLLVEDALKRYRQRTGCLLLCATHAPSQARRIADRAVMLSAGRVVENGPTDRVLSQPESAESRDFLSYWAV